MPLGWSSRLLRHRWLVLASWLFAIALGLAGGATLTSHLSTSLTVPGSQSEKADVILASHFGENSEGNFTILYKFGNASDSQIAQSKNAIEVAASVIPTAVVTQQKALGAFFWQVSQHLFL